MALQKAFPISNGKPRLPGFDSRALQIIMPFGAQNLSTYALQISLADVGLDSIQTVFVDNSNNNSPVTLAFQGANERCVCPPYSQGFFPVLFLGGPNLVCTATTAGLVDVPCQFMNVGGDVFPAIIWSVATPVGVGVQTVQGTVSVGPTVGAYTNRSGNIASAGVSQSLMNPNGARKRMIIKNPASITGQNIAQTESLFIDFGTAAGVDNGVSLELQPGEGYDSATGPVSSQQVFVTAATAGHRYIAKEM